MADTTDSVIRSLLPLIQALEYLGIKYYIGGSLASSAYGISRPTQDADVVADIHTEHIYLLTRSLETEYYIDADMIRDAIRHRSSFNIIYQDLMFKVDIFIPKSRSYAQQELARTQISTIPGSERGFYLSSPEDIILNKLEWYKMGGEISTRQWNDVLGVLNRQKATLDLTYLRQWAQDLQVSELLERVLAEAGIEK